MPELGIPLNRDAVLRVEFFRWNFDLFLGSLQSSFPSRDDVKLGVQIVKSSPILSLQLGGGNVKLWKLYSLGPILCTSS